MQDFNFFEGHNGKQKKSPRQRQLIQAAVVFGMLMILLPMVNLYRIDRFEREVQSTGAMANATEISEKRNTLEKKGEATEKLKTFYQSLVGVKSSLQRKDMINDFLIYTIRDVVPEDLFIKSMTIEPNNINIQGVAKSKVDIAKLQYSLEQIPTFQEIYIPNITGDDGSYTFSISIIIKDVAKDETH